MASRAVRASRACDECSTRKIKCDEDGPPCRACRTLGIPCTFSRPTRRRGPRSRYADSSLYVSPTPEAVSDSDATHNDPPWTVFCPSELQRSIINDFFTYLYPLMPFPYEPWFRAQMLHPTTPRFQALLASVVGATVSCHPAKASGRLADAGLLSMSRRTYTFAQSCYRYAITARGVSFLSASNLSVWDAMVSFFLSQILRNVGDLGACQLYAGECNNILNALGFCQPERTDLMSETTPSGALAQQMGRRLYWWMVKHERSALVSGQGWSPLGSFMNSRTGTWRHPPLPAAAANEQVLGESGAQGATDGSALVMESFNASARIYQSLDSLLASDVSNEISGTSDRATRNMLLTQAFLQAQNAYSAALSGSSDISYTHTSAAVDDSDQQTMKRAYAQILQRADVDVAYLTTRSYILERYWMALSFDEDDLLWSPARPTANYATPLDNYSPHLERLNIAGHMLQMLERTPTDLQASFSSSLAARVRYIASTVVTYTSSAGGATTKSEVSEQANWVFHELSSHVMRLEGRETPPSPGG